MDGMGEVSAVSLNFLGKLDGTMDGDFSPSSGTPHCFLRSFNLPSRQISKYVICKSNKSEAVVVTSQQDSLKFPNKQMLYQVIHSDHFAMVKCPFQRLLVTSNVRG